MIIYRSIDEIVKPLRNPVVTIGNFDGVHLGHREIFRQLKRAAVAIDGVSVIITFAPHPLKVLSTNKSITLINTLEEKITLIEASGIDYLIIIPFDEDFAKMSATGFVTGILVGKIGLKRLIIGYDYAFGRRREGGIELLNRLGDELSFEVEELEPITLNGVVYSSSLIRRLIADGAVSEALIYLGRNYSLGGHVVRGLERGMRLGFPTANIVTDKELIPAEGVYAVTVKISDRMYDAACNIGGNPTFANLSQSIEVHIFDFSDNLYGLDIRIYFIARIRREVRFASQELLAAAIAEDVAKCRAILAGAQVVAYREYLEGL